MILRCFIAAIVELFTGKCQKMIIYKIFVETDIFFFSNVRKNVNVCYSELISIFSTMQTNTKKISRSLNTWSNESKRFIKSIYTDNVAFQHHKKLLR